MHDRNDIVELADGRFTIALFSPLGALWFTHDTETGKAASADSPQTLANMSGRTYATADEAVQRAVEVYGRLEDIMSGTPSTKETVK